MQKGYVFTTPAEGFFGIFTPNAKPYVLVRVINANTVQDACDSLSREFAGHFEPAGKGAAAIGRHLMRTRDTLVLR